MASHPFHPPPPPQPARYLIYNIQSSSIPQVDIFSYGVMMVHVLSGQWPFPGEAVHVNPRSPNNPNDLVGVTEFDRREEYINLIGNEHPLMTLIRHCLSNSPSHRPTSSEVHQRVSAVAADHPPSFTNRVEMMERIKALGEEKETMRFEKDNAITEKDAAIMKRDRSIAELKETQSSLCQSHSVEVEALKIVNADLKIDNEHLQATVKAKEKMYKSKQEAIISRYGERLETMKKEKKATEEQYQSSIRSSQAEKEKLVNHHQSEIDVIKHNHQEEIEALKCSHQSDRQALEQQQALQLKDLQDEHQIMEQQHQAQLESKMNELSAKDALISSKSSTIQSLQVKLGQALGISSSKDNLSVFSPGMKLTFAECTKLPVCINGLDQGIVIGKDVSVGVGLDRRILNYNITNDTWSTLPRAPVRYATIGYLYKTVLLIIGGRLLSPSNQVTADIHEFDEASQQWVRSTSIPPMPTARSSATAISWSSPPALIVCGGNHQHGQPMAVVEVYHSRTSQWHAVSPLPFPRDRMTHTVIYDMLYLVGGYEGSLPSTFTKMVMSTSIPQLLETCLQPSPIQWQSLPIPNVPHYWSTAASLRGCLLVVGGLKDVIAPPKPNSVVSSVHAFCPFTSSWVLVGELSQPCFSCTTATLPTGELLVMGGGSPSGECVKLNDTTYICSVSMRTQYNK